MVKSIIILLRRTKCLEDKINKWEAREEQAVNEENIEEEFTFPLENEDQLVEFETKLKNPIFFQKMVRFQIKINYKFNKMII